MLAYHRGAEERMNEVIRDFHPMGGGTITAEERKRQHELVSSPPSSSRVGRWRTEMSAEDRQAFEGVAGDLLAELGLRGLSNPVPPRRVWRESWRIPPLARQSKR